MLDDAEWVEALDYLLRRLEAIGASDVAAEIRSAVSTRIVEQRINQVRFGVPAVLYREVGSATTRLPTPREAFTQAIEVIRIRLEMLPVIGLQTARLLQREPSEIIWRSEKQSHLFLSNPPEFTCSDLVLTSDDQQVIASSLQHLLKLIEQSEQPS